jgi:hypothetical protein
MSPILLRRLTGMTLGGFAAYLVARLSAKQRRIENHRRLIVASYDDAAADPAFMAEFGETMRDWNGTVDDGLEPEPAAS